MSIKLDANYNQVVCQLNREMEKAYGDLPWPKEIKRIVLATEVKGGRGDVAAAARVIRLMQEISPELTFDWVLFNNRDKINAREFLDCKDPSKVYVREMPSFPVDKEPGDFLIVGPVKCKYDAKVLERDVTHRKLDGPFFAFMEIAEEAGGYIGLLQNAMARDKDLTVEELYKQHVHPTLFSSTADPLSGSLVMGLAPSSGVFLDPYRMEASLPRSSQLDQIEDVDLRSDIREALGEGSFNSGYAHHAASWAKFIDCVAIHEKEKNVVIVLNQNECSTSSFQKTIFTAERIAFLRKLGYGSVFLKGKESSKIPLSWWDFFHIRQKATRTLTVIVRRSFTPKDMRSLQLASQRLLGTGDNSATEAFATLCELFVYEDVKNVGCKWRFLQQQVDLANTVHPKLGRLLALFGDDRRVKGVSDAAKMAEIEEILNDPEISGATQRFCHEIRTRFSFDAILEKSLKRAAWRQCVKELADVEAEVLGEGFRHGIVSYLQNMREEKTVPVGDLAELKGRVETLCNVTLF